MLNMKITKKDIKYITEAIEASKQSNMLMKHGCVVVENNHIVGRGCNSYRTRFQDNFIGTSCSCHAEMYALRMALKTKLIRNLSCFRKKVVQRQHQKNHSKV